MKDENFNPCENCPYDDNGWCCCKDNLPNDALCYMEEVMLMTNEEKFSKGIVVYRTEDDVICELWGASTKHADVIYSMNRDIKNDLFVKCRFADSLNHDIFQWLLYIASRQTWKTTAKEIVEIALAEWYF